MNQLPYHNQLEIGKLSAVFGNTTNSYKFYWFLAILDSMKEKEDRLISLNELALRMVANVWYPLDYYKLSFGKQDSFKEIAKSVSAIFLLLTTVSIQKAFLNNSIII